VRPAFEKNFNLCCTFPLAPLRTVAHLGDDFHRGNVIVTRKKQSTTFKPITREAANSADGAGSAQWALYHAGHKLTRAFTNLLLIVNKGYVLVVDWSLSPLPPSPLKYRYKLCVTKHGNFAHVCIFEVQNLNFVRACLHTSDSPCPAGQRG